MPVDEAEVPLASGGADPAGRNFRADIRSMEETKKQYVGLEVDQVRQVKQLQEERKKTLG
jgi:hypothetical protein